MKRSDGQWDLCSSVTKMPDFELKAVAREHLAAIAEIEKECFSCPWSEKALEDTLILGQGTGVVALHDGDVAAYGGMVIALDEAEITNVATTEAHRGKGYAKAVMCELFRVAHERGCVSMSLEVRESNSAAISLYEGLGFENLGRRPNFYRFPREAAIIMVKRLS